MPLSVTYGEILEYGFVSAAFNGRYDYDMICLSCAEIAGENGFIGRVCDISCLGICRVAAFNGEVAVNFESPLFSRFSTSD